MLHLDASAWNNKLQRIIPPSSHSLARNVSEKEARRESRLNGKLSMNRKVDPKAQIENITAYTRHTERSSLPLSSSPSTRKIDALVLKQEREEHKVPRKKLEKENIRGI